MKSKFINCIAVLSIACLMIGSTENCLAQDKPKGDPWSAPESAAKKKSPFAVADEVLAEGKILYSKHCKSCHGSSGKGDGSKAAKIDISCGDFTTEEFSKETDGALYWKTTEGRDPMPSFKKKATDEERWMIVHYMRTFKTKK